MDTTHLVITIVFGIIFLIPLTGMLLVVKERLEPFEKRKQRVRDELRNNESATGSTSISSGIGVSDETTKELAKEEGFEWVGYTGRRNPNLNFQRSLPSLGERGTNQGDTGTANVESRSPESVFLSRLAAATPDVRGRDRIDMTDIPPKQRRGLRETAEAHGWRVDRPDFERRRVYWEMSRIGSSSVDRSDPYFVTGPGLSELRQYPQARSEAADAERDLGVNPLSDAALDATRTRHRRLWRLAVRWGGLASCSGLALVTVLLAGWRMLADGGIGAAVLAIVCAVLVAGLALGSVMTARKQSERKKAVATYTNGYQRVVAAVLDEARASDEQVHGEPPGDAP